VFCINTDSSGALNNFLHLLAHWMIEMMLPLIERCLIMFV